MAKDIEQELDAIFAPHKARMAQARNEVAGKTAAADDFAQAATVCLAQVITPALQQMAGALNDVHWPRVRWLPVPAGPARSPQPAHPL